MRRKKWLKRAIATLVAIAAADLAANALLRADRVKQALARRLAAAFGRPVAVGHFSLSLFPPALEAAQVTVSEDPAFGHEYFLRADQVTLGLRWSGLLHGKLEFATFSLSRPSLNLVRDAFGGWNLDRWLPPARRDTAGVASGMGPPAPPPPATARLSRVDFDEGRVDFKKGDDKLPFAFVQVSGRVEQVAPGRWTLDLEARPWRGGVSLQAAGRLFVSGEIAGTSLRLQPAELRLHWTEASLADLMRLARGHDSGLRGAVSVDAVARSGTFPAGSAGGGSNAPPNAATRPGEWTFHLEARAQQIHRWDLTERADNPALNLIADGRWNIGSSELEFSPMRLEAPRSNVRGEASYATGPRPSFEVRVDSAAIQASDALAWYRAFHAGVAEDLTALGMLSFSATLKGWPVELQNAAFSSRGATVRVPGLTRALHVGPFEGGRTRNRLALDVCWITLDPKPETAAQARALARVHQNGGSAILPSNTAVGGGSFDLATGAGALWMNASVDRIEHASALAKAFGRPLERGWELEGRADAGLQWSWAANPADGELGGGINFRDARLQVAGLNLPVAVNAARLFWEGRKRGASLRSVEAFGAEWSGEVSQSSRAAAGEGDAGSAAWNFELHADHLNAADFDRWTGPRARPGWLERLLESLSGGASRDAQRRISASELIHRIRADGEIRVDEFSVEKLTMRNVTARASLADLRLELRDASADYAAGTIRGRFSADFSPRPRYALDARLDKIQLGALLSPAPEAGDPPGAWQGVAGGEIHLATSGVGRNDLFAGLTARGRLQLRNVSLRGWDAGRSLREGSLQHGDSRWSAGEGEFTLQDGEIELRPVELIDRGEHALLRGTVTLARTADLELSRVPPGKGPAARVLRIRGPLAAPEVSLERTQ
ncbi:MAG TPA: AsmA family protein [Methylomirabilota bacterium]|nr:AsmA family protein [Methylomirabilota bacterium]